MNRRILIVIVAIILTCIAKINAQTPADSAVVIRCISVLNKDSISLTWTIPNDTAGFSAYLIYVDSSGGNNFSLRGSVLSSSQTTYTDPTAETYNINNIYSYYIRVRFVNGTDTTYSIPSDTLQPIMVHVSNIGTGGLGVASITWNANHVPLLTSSTGWYYLYKEVGYPAGTWIFLDSTKQLSYTDSNATFCQKVLGYYVTINDTNNTNPCTSISDIGSELFFNFTPPAVVLVDSVSIDPLTGEILIGWAPDSSLSTIYYQVVQRISGAYWTHVDSIHGIDSTFFSTSFSTSPVDSFFVLAYDSCEHSSNQGSIQSTIHLNMMIDTCGQSVVLTWNPYTGWAYGVSQYYILLRMGNGAWVTIDSVGDSVNTYSYTQLNQFNTFSFRIRAKDSITDYTSSSNVGLIDIVIHNLPHFEYIKTATVLDNSHIRLDLHTDVSAQVSRYNIQRTVDTALGFTTIGYTGKYSNADFSYIDSFLIPEVTQYFYRFTVLDSCMNIVDSSNIVQTILLKATPNANISNTITWSAYVGFAGGDSCYALYRSIDGVLNPNPIAVLPYSRNSYTDSVSAFMNSQGEFCYYVVQYEATLDSFGFQDSSQSNLGCAAQSPALFIPNSFTPFGKNPIFIPVWTFTDIHLYDLSIYSRLGDLIFNSTNPFVGWDGTYQGYIVPMDVYVWTITLTGQNDTQIKRTGSVLVLR